MNKVYRDDNCITVYYFDRHSRPEQDGKIASEIYECVEKWESVGQLYDQTEEEAIKITDELVLNGNLLSAVLKKDDQDFWRIVDGPIIVKEYV